MSLRFNSCGNVDCLCLNHTKAPEYSMSDQRRANAVPLSKLAQSNSKSEDTPLRHEEICPDYKFGRHYDNRNLVGGFICGCKDDCPNHLQDSPLGQATSLEVTLIKDPNLCWGNVAIKGTRINLASLFFAMLHKEDPSYHDGLEPEHLEILKDLVDLVEQTQEWHKAEIAKEGL